MALDGVMGRVARTLVSTLAPRTATYRYYTTPEYDNATGETGITETDVACVLSFIDWDDMSVDGAVIKRGDRRAIVARLALGREPVADLDRIIEGGRVWQIVNVKGYSSGNNEAAYELHLRR